MKSSEITADIFVSAISSLYKETGKPVTLDMLAAHFQTAFYNVQFLKRKFKSSIKESGFVAKIGRYGGLVRKEDLPIVENTEDVKTLIRSLDEEIPIVKSEFEKVSIPDQFNINSFFQNSSNKDPKQLGKELIDHGMWCMKVGHSLLCS